MTGDGASDDRRTRVSRRQFVVATGASGVSVGLAGCADLVGWGQNGDGDDGGDQKTTDGTQTGTTGDGDGEATVTFGFDPDASQENGDAIRQALHEQGGLSDEITIEFAPGDQNTDQRRANYNRLLGADERNPDLFLMDNGWVNVFIQRGQLQNLSELLSDEAVSTIDEEYFEGFTATARDPASGDLFGVPIFPDLPTMQYRIDLVEEAGYSPIENDWATEPMTWMEWSHVTADVFDDADVEYGFTTQWDVYGGTACCTFNEVMSSWGGAYFGGRDNLFGPVGDRPITVDSKPVIRSLNMMRKFVHDEEVGELGDYAGGFTPTDVLGWLEEDSLAPFASGDAVMHRNWVDSLAMTGQNPDETDDPALGENLGAMPIPYAVTEEEAEFEGTGGTTAALGGWHATVNPNTRKQDAVSEVVEALMTPEFQLKLFSLQGWLPPRPELFESSEARDVPVVGQYLDTLQVAGENVMARPVTPVWDDQASVIAQEANRAVGQETSSENAMQNLKSSLKLIENEG